ncbi:hypothetical protein [Kitasatospora sp. NPDC057500]|uniref:hypothetical protein n=1 Tax=Kitasatospora sp. NPDC057500 TaxID=3346151 RepID=UPI0036C692A8
MTAAPRTVVRLLSDRLDVPGFVPGPEPERPAAEPKRRRSPGLDASALAPGAAGPCFLPPVTGRRPFDGPTGRPRHAVQRTRRREQALTAAAALADPGSIR